MIYLSRRSKQIIYKFTDTPDAILTSYDLAQETNVSTRTIKQDISDLNPLLKQYGASIEPRLGKGYQLEIADQFLFRQLVSELKSQDTNTTADIPKYRYERISYIIKKLLAIDYYISLEDLAGELYVSRSTLSADLKEVRSILSEYNLSIVSKPNYGIILEGNEINRRLCISEYYFHSTVSTGFFALDHALFVSSANQIEINKIEEILREVISEYSLNLSDASFQNMVIHIVISIRRWRFYNYVRMDKKNADKIARYREYEAGKALKVKLEQWLNIILPYEESLYFTLHFHSKHMSEIAEISPESNRSTERTLNKIYDMLQQKYGITNIDKDRFEMYLRLHIPVMVERLETGMIVRNSQTYSIIGNYPLATHITYDISKIIEEEYQVKMNIH